MKRFVLIVLFNFVCGAVLTAQPAGHPVISEVLVDGVSESAAASNDEFIEIYNPTESPVDVSGWTVDYRSASGSTYNNRHTFVAGTIIPPHRYYLVGGGGVADRDNSGASITMGLGNSGGGAFLRNSSGTVIDVIGWGTASASNCEGAAPAVPSQGISLERKANSASTSLTMGSAGADEFEGNGYDSDNNATDFVSRPTPQPQNSSGPVEPSLAQGGNGTGTAFINPKIVYVTETREFELSIVGDGTHTIDSVIIVVPSRWTWDENASGVSLAGAGFSSSTVLVNGDTVFIGAGAITGTDTGKVTFNSLTVPDSAGTVQFIVRTGLQGGSPVQIAATVSVSVLKLVPIVLLHSNNSNGVPVTPYQVGATVTVTGVITADLNPSRTDIYLQDETGGVNVFSFSRSFNYEVGDSVTVTGSIVQFRGLVEISPDTAKYILHKKNAQVPEPVLVTAAEVNATFNTDDYTEPNESRLVRINNVTFVPGSGGSGTITDATGTTGTFIPVPPLTAPIGTFDLIGILKQFKPGTTDPGPPYTGDYEVVPRIQSDIILYAGPLITVPPFETNIKSNEVTIQWKTSDSASSSVKYGTTASLTDSVGDATPTTDHAITLSGLQPSTVYYYQIISTDESGTTVSATYFFITGSLSTGTMNVYFSRSIDPTVAQSETAKVADLSGVLINRINTAAHSIDFCTYSLSGTVGANVATALLNARNRGVKIRVIGEKDNQGTAPWSTLKNGGVTVIDDGYDVTNAGNGLMHNKFFVFDHRDNSSSEDDWVVMGSWNATDPGTNNDAQNVVEIQDKSLAAAYTMEFEEMWGSGSDSPDQGASRFGSRKKDNTPHRFVIGTVPVESYFSPSDKTTLHITNALNTAASSINVAMLSFTRDELAQALVAKKSAGKKVRVVVDNNSDSGNDFAYLQTNGVDIRLPGTALPGLLHHKYAIVDADNPSDENIVVTGSHNWSSAAENSNNENTLIIRSERIANLYLQEFKARYIEAGGTDPILVSIKREEVAAPNEFLLQQNYPNPFNPETTIRFQIARSGLVRLSVYDVLGREIASLMDRELAHGVYSVRWNASSFSSGVYYCRLQSGGRVESKKMVLMK